MGNSTATITEVRLDLTDEQITECYVLVMAGGDSPIGVQGWHHKSFPARISAIDIFSPMHFRDYLLWPLSAPPDNPGLRNSFPTAFDLAQENDKLRKMEDDIPMEFIDDLVKFVSGMDADSVPTDSLSALGRVNTWLSKYGLGVFLEGLT